MLPSVTVDKQGINPSMNGDYYIEYKGANTAENIQVSTPDLSKQLHPAHIQPRHVLNLTDHI